MNDRQLFRETFDEVKAPDSVLERILEQTAPKKRRSHRGMVAIFAAVILVVTLSVTAVGAWHQSVFKKRELQNKADMIAQCNQELTILHEMGLFVPELSLTLDDFAPEHPQTSSIAYTVRHNRPVGDLDYSIRLTMSPATNKLLCLTISVYGADPEPVVEPDMTLKDYCDIWAEYQGYAWYEMPEGVDPDTLLLEAHALVQWEGGITNDYFHTKENGLTFSFYPEDQSTPEIMYLSYNNDHSICFGSDYFKG